MGSELELSVPTAHRASFVKARAAFCDDDAATARALFDEMEKALPHDLEIRLYAACSRARLAMSLKDGEREELERLAREALRTGKSLALPLCILAHAAVRRRDLPTALRLFRRATTADPLLVDARRGLRMAEQQLRDGRVRGRRMSFAVSGRFALALALFICGLAAMVMHAAS